MFVNILLAVLGIGFLIFIHEGGHYSALDSPA
jgi:membrane-associated protease RseP (regulator of RpoE activity)